MTTITTTTPLVPAHRVAVTSVGHEYLAECSCGWAGDWQAPGPPTQPAPNTPTRRWGRPTDSTGR